MANPVVGTPVVVSTAASEVAVPLPAGVTAGAKVIVSVAQFGSWMSPPTPPVGATVVDPPGVMSDGTANSSHGLYDVTVPNPVPATMTWTFPTARQAVGVAIFDPDRAGPVQAVPRAVGNGANPNPPPVTPTGAARVYVFGHNNRGVALTAPPAGFTQLFAEAANGTSFPSVASWGAWSTGPTPAATVDPGVATIDSTTDNWGTTTLVVPTVAAVNPISGFTSLANQTFTSGTVHASAAINPGNVMLIAAVTSHAPTNDDTVSSPTIDTANGITWQRVTPGVGYGFGTTHRFRLTLFVASPTATTSGPVTVRHAVAPQSVGLQVVRVDATGGKATWPYLSYFSGVQSTDPSFLPMGVTNPAGAVAAYSAWANASKQGTANVVAGSGWTEISENNAGVVGPLTTLISDLFGFSPLWDRATGGGHYTVITGATASMTFTCTAGTTLNLICSKDVVNGIVGVTIDGVETLVDQYSPTPQTLVSVWTSAPLTVGSHNISIRCTGTKNVAATAAYAALDRVDATGGTVTTAANRTLQTQGFVGFPTEASINWSNAGVSAGAAIYIGYQSSSNASPNAGVDRAYSAPEGSTYRLSADGAAPATPGNTLTYFWSNAGNLNSTSITDPTGTAPGGPSTRTHVLTVTETQTGLTDTSTHTVTVDNVPPTARAGNDFAVNTGGLFTLNGTGSTDPADTLTHAWSLVDAGGTGFTVGQLTGVNTATATGTAPTTTGTVTFRLTVNDGTVTRTDDVVMTVVTTGAPTLPWTPLKLDNIAAPSGVAYYVDEVEFLDCNPGESHLVDRYGTYEGAATAWTPGLPALSPTTSRDVTVPAIQAATTRAGVAQEFSAFGAAYNVDLEVPAVAETPAAGWTTAPLLSADLPGAKQAAVAVTEALARSSYAFVDAVGLANVRLVKSITGPAGGVDGWELTSDVWLDAEPPVDPTRVFNREFGRLVARTPDATTRGTAMAALNNVAFPYGGAWTATQVGRPAGYTTEGWGSAADDFAAIYSFAVTPATQAEFVAWGQTDTILRDKYDLVYAAVQSWPSPPTLPTIPPSSNEINVNLVANGTDQTATFFGAVAAAPNGTAAAPTVLRVNTGNFRLDGVTGANAAGSFINDKSHVHVLGQADGSTHFYSNVNIIARRHLQMRLARNCVARYLNFHGPATADGVAPGYPVYNALWENQHAFAQIHHCQDSQFLDCTAENVYGDGIYVGNMLTVGSVHHPVRNAEFHRVTVNRVGRQGIALTGVEGVKIWDCTVDWAYRSLIDIEPNAAVDRVYDVDIQRLKGRARFGYLTLGGAIQNPGTVFPRSRNVLLKDFTDLMTSATQRAGTTHIKVHTGVHAGYLTIDNVRMKYARNSRGPSGVDQQGTSMGFHGNTGAFDLTVRNCHVTSTQSLQRHGIEFGAGLVIGSAKIENNVFDGPGHAALYAETGTSLNTTVVTPPVWTQPKVLTTCGNVWNSGISNDGSCAAPPLPPPVISAVNTSVNSSSVTVTWATNEAATSVVEYGTTTAYGSTATVTGTRTSHSVTATGLTAATTYNLRIRTTNAAGTEAVGANRTATTSPAGTFSSRNLNSTTEVGYTGFYDATLGRKLQLSDLAASGSVTLTTPGQVLLRKNVTGTVKVDVGAGNTATIRQCRVRANSTVTAIVEVVSGSAVLEWVEVDAGNYAGANIIGYSNWSAFRCNFHNGQQDGGKMNGNVTLDQSWVHDQVKTANSHNDGLQNTGADNNSGIIIRDSRVDGPYRRTVSALKFSTQNGTIDDVLVTGCYLSGGGYTLYYDDKNQGYGAPTNLRVIDNVFEKHSTNLSSTGAVTERWRTGNGHSTQEWRGNRWHTGELIPGQPNTG